MSPCATKAQTRPVRPKPWSMPRPIRRFACRRSHRVSTTPSWQRCRTLPRSTPGQCVTMRDFAPISVGFPTGPQFLVVAVDPTNFTAELVEQNNISAFGPFGFGQGPDLTVAKLTVPPTADGLFTAQVEVCNLGNDIASLSNLTLYASTDPTIEPLFETPASMDVEIGSTLVPSLVAQECQVLAIDASAPFADPGPYFVGAVVDEPNSVLETLETNNITVVGPIGFGFGPDLVVDAVSTPPSSDGSFDATVTVCNQGTGVSENTDVVLYVSADQTIDTSPSTEDIEIGLVPAPPLLNGQCASVTANVAVPGLPSGPYFVGGIVDRSDAVSELIESNNTTVVGPIGIGAGPDLTVAEIALPPSAQMSFTSQVTVCNQGTEPAAGTDVALYASADASIESPAVVPWSEDFFLGNAQVPVLGAGACATVEVFSSVPAVPLGAFFVGAIVDEVNSVPELLEGNNTTVVGPIGFGLGPDLVVTDVGTLFDLSTGVESVEVTVCNEGTDVAGGPLEVEVYASSDQQVRLPPEVPSLDDVQLVVLGDPRSLNPGQCFVLSSPAPLSILPAGPQFLVAVADVPNFIMELREDNNLTAFGPFGLGQGPDLTARQVTVPPTANGPFVAQVEVCNDGRQGSPPASLTLYGSVDSTIEPLSTVPWSSDIELGFASVPTLGAQECQLLSVNATSAFDEPGAYFVGAVVGRDGRGARDPRDQQHHGGRTHRLW